MDLWKYYDGDLKYPNILNHSHEKEIAKTKPKWAFEYAYSKQGKDEELEPIISTSSYHSYWYAKYVLNEQPFPLGEKAITKSSEYSYLYAREILKKSFKMGEPAISKEAGYSYYYAKNILIGVIVFIGMTAFPEGDLERYQNYYYRYFFHILFLSLIYN